MNHNLFILYQCSSIYTTTEVLSMSGRFCLFWCHCGSVHSTTAVLYMLPQSCLRHHIKFVYTTRVMYILIPSSNSVDALLRFWRHCIVLFMLLPRRFCLRCGRRLPCLRPAAPPFLLTHPYCWFPSHVRVCISLVDCVVNCWSYQTRVPDCIGTKILGLEPFWRLRAPPHWMWRDRNNPNDYASRTDS